MLTAAAIAAAVIAWRRSRPFPLVAAGDSMAPTIPSGSLLLAVPSAPRVGDVVVVARPGMEVVKRVAGIDGDAVALLGDNPLRSTDSRSFGTVDRADVRGVVRAVYWPPRAWRRL